MVTWSKQTEEETGNMLRIDKIIETDGTFYRRLVNIAIPDAYVEHGNVELLKQEIGIDAGSIVKRIWEVLDGK